VTPDQKIALASVISGGVVGLAGLVVAALAGRLDRVSSRKMVREERHQQRLADAYVALLEVAEKIGNWAALVRPALDSMPPRDPPPLPDVDIQIRVTALVNAYGSDDVKTRLKEWRDTVSAIRNADLKIARRLEYAQRGDATGPIADYLGPWNALEDTLRPAETEARRLITEQVAAELRPPT